MKKVMKLSLAVVAALFMSCSDDDNNDNNNVGNDEMYMRFTAEGEDYDIADPTTVSTLNTTITGFEGADGTFRRVALWMPNDITEGTYAIDDAIGSQYEATYYTGDITADATTGTLTITDIDAEYIEGTYSFTADDVAGDGTYAVTNGSFRAYRPE